MPSAILPLSDHTKAPALVLDTNVVLDWLVFGNRACEPLECALSAGHARWLASSAMRDELAHVLGRGLLDDWKPNLPALWRAWDRHSVRTEAAALAGAALRLRCSDADDQKFIDLAIGHGARWLLSRDRAVLKLARRALPFGLSILTPEAWAVDGLSG